MEATAWSVGCEELAEGLAADAELAGSGTMSQCSHPIQYERLPAAPVSIALYGDCDVLADRGALEIGEGPHRQLDELGVGSDRHDVVKAVRHVPRCRGFGSEATSGKGIC